MFYFCFTFDHFCAAKVLSRAGCTLHEVQCHLDREGASDLVVELVIKSVHSPSIFGEAVELGIALLEGGNPVIQKSMYSKLLGGDLSQAFFKVCISACCVIMSLVELVSYFTTFPHFFLLTCRCFMTR